MKTRTVVKMQKVSEVLWVNMILTKFVNFSRKNCNWLHIDGSCYIYYLLKRQRR